MDQHKILLVVKAISHQAIIQTAFASTLEIGYITNAVGKTTIKMRAHAVRDGNMKLTHFIKKSYKSYTSRYILYNLYNDLSENADLSQDGSYAKFMRRIHKTTYRSWTLPQRQPPKLLLIGMEKFTRRSQL